jgi:hypothetical protein
VGKCWQELSEQNELFEEKEDTDFNLLLTVTAWQFIILIQEQC